MWTGLAVVYQLTVFSSIFWLPTLAWGRFSLHLFHCGWDSCSAHGNTKSIGTFQESSTRNLPIILKWCRKTFGFCRVSSYRSSPAGSPLQRKSWLMQNFRLMLFNAAYQRIPRCSLITSRCFGSCVSFGKMDRHLVKGKFLSCCPDFDLRKPPWTTAVTSRWWGLEKPSTSCWHFVKISVWQTTRQKTKVRLFPLEALPPSDWPRHSQVLVCSSGTMMSPSWYVPGGDDIIELTWRKKERERRREREKESKEGRERERAGGGEREREQQQQQQLKDSKMTKTKKTPKELKKHQVKVWKSLFRGFFQ